MARTPMVTRTIQATTVTVLCVNTIDEKTEVKDIVLPRTYKDDKSILKALANVITEEAIKPVHVISTTVTETLYGMSETDFIHHAKVLPPRTTATID